MHTKGTKKKRLIDTILKMVLLILRFLFRLSQDLLLSLENLFVQLENLLKLWLTYLYQKSENANLAAWAPSVMDPSPIGRG
jgi:cell division protein FtsB